MLENTDTLEVEVLCDDATVLLAPSGALECLDKRRLTIVRPAGIDMVRRLRRLGNEADRPFNRMCVLLEDDLDSGPRETHERGVSKSRV